MKKTLFIDDDLLAEAKAACSSQTDTETIRLGLQALVRYAAQQRLRALKGTEKAPRDVPRRRPRAGKRKAA
jgi:Arc/MetJ family transcription regulator